MCPHLDGLGLQVLTNSLHIVSALSPQPNTRISIPGGAVFREQNIVLCALEEISTLVTDQRVTDATAQEIGRAGIRLVVASAP